MAESTQVSEAAAPSVAIRPTVSVVVPVFNSQQTLRELVVRLTLVLEAAAGAHEIVLVNDGSRDRSWATICDLVMHCPNVRGINLMRNYGQQNAILAGIREAACEVVVVMDDDLQHPPEEIPKLLAKLAEGYDVVYGTSDQGQHGLWRDLAAYLTRLALRSAMGVETAGKVSAFRAFRTHLRRAFAAYQSPFVSVDVLLTWGAARFGSVQVQHHPRAVGRSNYTFRTLLTVAINLMTAFSVLPLQLASICGFATTLFGLAVLVYVVGRYLLLGYSVPGFPFLASTIAIFSGAQMFALGIIGEYLARMHFRMMERPPYAVRESASTGRVDAGVHREWNDVRDAIRAPQR